MSTYIWYSSTASTSCPHESKSVPFVNELRHIDTCLLLSSIVNIWVAKSLLTVVQKEAIETVNEAFVLLRDRGRKQYTDYCLTWVTKPHTYSSWAFTHWSFILMCIQANWNWSHSFYHSHRRAIRPPSQVMAVRLHQIIPNAHAYTIFSEIFPLFMPLHHMRWVLTTESV